MAERQRVAPALPLAEQGGGCVVEAQARTQNAVFEIRKFLHGGPERGVLALDCSFIELAFDDRAAPAEAMYETQPSLRPSRLGRAFFVPAGHAADCIWQPLNQRSISCALDLRALTGIELEWTPRRLAAGLDVRNHFVHGVLQRLTRELLEPSFGRAVMLDMLSPMLGLELVRYFQGLPAQKLPRAAKLDRAELDHIRDMLTQAGARPSIAALARKYEVSERHLARLFHEATGQSMSGFAAAQRVAQAKAALAKPRVLIKQIAFDCGFTNVAAFAAAFRKATGLTPSQYRLEHAGSASRQLM